jgi:hypothetical protein
MINGLRLAMSGDEIILALNERIEQYRSSIRFKRDEIEGKVERPQGMAWEVPAEAVEEEILIEQHRMHTLMMIREHILEGQTYLIDRRDLAFAELLPQPPGAGPDLDPSKEMRWVARPVTLP